MYRPTHDPAIISHMIGEHHAHADADRLAALARGRRSQRPSLLTRVSGRIAALAATPLHHRPVRHTAVRSARP
jgi:hypothetical protein